jgi:hypothetical protein
MDYDRGMKRLAMRGAKAILEESGIDLVDINPSGIFVCSALDKSDEDLTLKLTQMAAWFDFMAKDVQIIVELERKEHGIASYKRACIRWD